MGRALVMGYTSSVSMPLLQCVGHTVPSLFPKVGPANDMKMSAPHAAAFFRPSASCSSPWMMDMLVFEERSEGILEGVRT